MSYYEIRLSRASMECVISSLNAKSSLALELGESEEAKIYSDLEAYFKSKLSDSYSVYE
jgi:hypothetical protein